VGGVETGESVRKKMNPCPLTDLEGTTTSGYMGRISRKKKRRRGKKHIREKLGKNKIL